MKKTITICMGILMLLDKQSNAQPVITNGNNWPAAGYSTNVKVAVPSAGTGTPGQNQTWDFTTQTFSSFGTFNVVDAATSAHGSNYPTATSCALLTPSGGSPLFFYWKMSSSKLEAITEAITTPGVGNDFTPGLRLWLKFPFNFNDTMSQSYHAADNSSNGSQTIKYDGTGTLKLPGITYTNVVRIQTVRGAYTDYSWYTLNPLFLVLEYSNNNNQLIAFTSTSAGVDELQNDLSVNIAPNPFTAHTFVNFSEEQRNSTIKITDVLGKKIKEEIFSGKQYPLEQGELQSGIYFVQIMDENKRVINKKIVIN